MELTTAKSKWCVESRETLKLTPIVTPAGLWSPLQPVKVMFPHLSTPWGEVKNLPLTRLESSTRMSNCVRLTTVQ